MLKIEKFLIAHPDAKDICDVIIPKDIIIDPDPKIKIFAVLKCEKTQKNRETLDFLTQEIKKYYDYRKERTTRLKEENIFENFLYNFNIELQQFLRKNRLLLNTKKTNFLIGIIYFDKINEKYNLYFAQIGNIAPLLIYKTKDNEYNIARIQEAVDENSDSAKIFSNMISGQTKENNSIIFCAENTLDYISLDKIMNIAKNSNANNIALEIKNLLMEIDEKEIFCGIAIKTEKNNETFSIIPETNRIEEKISEEKEEKEEESPKIIKEETASKETPREEKYEVREAKNDFTVLSEAKKEEIINKKQTFSKIFSIITLPIVKLFSVIKFVATGKIFIKLFKLPKYLKSLSTFRKLLLIAAIIFAVLFAQNTINIKQKNVTKEKEQEYQELLSQIESKKNDLEASLMFNSQSKSTAILLTLENLIKQLPQESEKEKEKLSKIEQEIKKMEFEAKLIFEITDPEKIADYSKLNKKLTTKIIKEGNIIYSITEDNDIFQLNLQNKSVEKIDCQQLSLPIAKSIIKTDENFIILHQKNSFSKLQKRDNKFHPIDVKFLQSAVDISSVEAYNNKLYTLDILNNQIQKHTPVGDNFSTGKEWLKGSIDLNNAVSMAIDGSIFVLNSDGDIFKLFKGEKQNFAFSNANKILTDPKKIWTDSSSLYLYILDAGGKKITVIDKDGKLIIQYYSDKFNNLNDFIIDEKEKKIYALADNKMFIIKITHLNN
ncbi:MAG: hypothetical protein U9O55_01795 [Patescibacteria group bacterium]|nr:hypothetical protein [Patescibacteria group bacterium]